jgi:sugar lactone lactonase YvrE
MDFEVVSNSRDALGESPVWEAATGRLFWVDIVRRQLKSLDLSSGAEQRWAMPDLISAAVAGADGTLAIALRKALARFDPAAGSIRTLCDLEPADGLNRANEMRCDPGGRLWVGTMMNNIGVDGAELPLTQSRGGLYRVNSRGAATRVLEAIGVPNSLAWSPAGDRMYFADTLTGNIDLLDFEPATGAARNRRRFASGGRGWPDGSAVDQDGCLWNARWDGGCVVRYTPDGCVDRMIELPTLRPTSCAFGGADLATLFITSASAPTDQQDGGQLFAVRPGVKGIPVGRFMA